jgi:hypothetical protein
VVVVAAGATVAAAEEEDMAAAVVVAAVATAVAIGETAKTFNPVFYSKSARFHSRALFVKSFSRSGCNVPIIRYSIEPRRTYGGGNEFKID